MKDYQIKVFTIFVTLTLVLFHYQNCASAKNLNGAADTSSNTGAAEGTIDTISTGGIDFIQNKATIKQGDSELMVYGICSAEQNGAMISWKVRDLNGEQLEKGKAVCDKGAFEVAFEGVDTLACGTQMRLDAYFGAKAYTNININKDCSN